MGVGADPTRAQIRREAMCVCALHFNLAQRRGCGAACQVLLLIKTGGNEPSRVAAAAPVAGVSLRLLSRIEGEVVTLGVTAAGCGYAKN